jgi:uncharacterized protein
MNCFPEILERALKGDAQSQVRLGLIYFEGKDTPKDLQKAEHWYEKAAAQGGAEIQYGIGLMYKVGSNAPQNIIKAFYWIEKAAQQGHAEAQEALGEMYMDSDIKTKDYKESEYWLKKAAKHHDTDSHRSLGFLYSDSENPDRNYKKSIYHFEKAADQGDALAAIMIGRLYDEDAEGVQPDKREALKWFLCAIRQDYCPYREYIYRRIGILYFKLGDFVSSHAWLKLAETRGDKDAENSIDTVKEKLSSADSIRSQGLYNDLSQKQK